MIWSDFFPHEETLLKVSNRNIQVRTILHRVITRATHHFKREQEIYYQLTIIKENYATCILNLTIEYNPNISLAMKY